MPRLTVKHAGERVSVCLYAQNPRSGPWNCYRIVIGDLSYSLVNNSVAKFFNSPGVAAGSFWARR
jgi:hypothetical protein